MPPKPDKIEMPFIVMKSGKQDANDAIPRSILFLTISSALGGFLFGYSTGVISGAVLFISKQFDLEIIWHQAIVSITIATAWLSSITAGNFADKFGRKKVILTSSIFYGIGSIVMALSPNKELLLVGRAIIGIAVGLSSMCIPLYLSEIAPLSVRGRLTITYTIFITGGQFIAMIVCWIFSNVQLGWRFMLGGALIPAIIQLICFIKAPESPRWLVLHKRTIEAEDILLKFRPRDANVKNEVNLMMVNSTDQEASIITILKSAPVCRALLLGCFLQIMQQLAGINTVLYYTANIVQMAGIRDETLIMTFSTLVVFCNFLFTFVGLWLVERIGRRLITLYSLGGVCISLFLLALSFNLAYVYNNTIGPNSSIENSFCSKHTSCSSCIRSPNCGICFDSTNLDVYNSSCVLVDPTMDHKNSKFGQCSSDVTPMTFAYDWCPNWFAWMSVLGMCIYLCCFAPGMGPMPWVINSEIYPNWARARCIAISTSINWAVNVALSLSFLSLVEAITKFGVFYFYMVFCVIGWIFFYFALPETKGIALEDMEKIFQSPVCSHNKKRQK